jgi:capsular exopolysaccharide synthesis family protein
MSNEDAMPLPQAFSAPADERLPLMADTPAVEPSEQPWKPDEGRLVFLKPQSVGIEEFRVLRSKLFRERSNRHLKTVLITGASPGEGKTFVAANLALSISRHRGGRVLLIDGDLRRSSMHTLLGIELSPGLSDYLSGDVQVSEIVRQTPEPGLCVVTAGKYGQTPTELLHSRRMQQFMEAMTHRFEWIIVDSPPATVVSDSSVLAEVCDGVILVLAPGTAIEAALKARKQFNHKPILGVVFNRADNILQYGDYYNSPEKSGRAS